MNNHRLSPRQFLQHTGSAAGASLAAGSIWLEADPITALPRSAPSDRIRFGIIGVGMEGVYQDAVFGNHAAIACHIGQ
jgi:hypothetical protein